MFEDKTYENILAECLATAPVGIDVRPGSIFYDAVASVAFKIAQFYADISTAFDLVFLTTAVDEYLDRKGNEYGVSRLPPIAATYEYVWAGSTEPVLGSRFFADDIFFVLRKNNNNNQFYLEAEIPGLKAGVILPGTAAIPVESISGLTVSEFGAAIIPGSDAESDNDYRDRIQEKIGGPAENGNRQQYKTWCESIPGVGRARIIPLFAGENTVMGVLIGSDGSPAPEAIVQQVQAYVDPIANNETVTVDDEIIPIGSGLGDGAASIGAHFSAVAAVEYPIDLAFSAELKSGATLEQIRSETVSAVTAYLKNLALDTPEKQTVVIRLSAVSSILHTLPGLLDYSGLTLNGETANIELSDRDVGVLGEVTVSEII